MWVTVASCRRNGAFVQSMGKPENRLPVSTLSICFAKDPKLKKYLVKHFHTSDFKFGERAANPWQDVENLGCQGTD